MISGSGSTQQSLRKALGTLKDSTTVGLAKVNSEYKDVDIAIIKATNHEEKVPKEKHIRTIFYTVSATESRADIQYCISSLARRLGKTRNWAVALKILIVIHRALREADPAFRGELINYISNRGHILNLSHFKDDSSPDAWDYSAWVRTYALYLEERLECFRVLKFDVEAEQPRMKELDTAGLLEHLPAFQQLLFRLLGCQPEGAAKFNSVIQYAFSIVAAESLKLYAAIDSGTLNMVNKFFDMQRHDAVRSLEIYRKAGQQAERLSEFYDFCKGLNLWKSEKFIMIKQPPESFATAMEEYVKDAPIAMPFPYNEVNGKVGSAPRGPPKAGLNAEDDFMRPRPISAPSAIEFMGFKDISWDATKSDEKNSLAHDILSDGKPSSRSTSVLEQEKEGTVQEPEPGGAVSGGGGGTLHMQVLDNLDEDTMMRRTSASGRSEGAAAVAVAVAADGDIKSHIKVAGETVVIDSTNPFGDPYGPMNPPPGQPSNPCTGLL